MGDQVSAVTILAVTVGLALWRPKVGRFRLDHAPAAILGALACLALGLITPGQAGESVVFLLGPVATIVSLMTVTIVAEQAGVFRAIARTTAQAADGDARKLFLYIFLSGSLVGTLFTNDAAVLIFTPLVYRLIEEVAEDDWTPSQKMPYYFAVLYVANVAGVLVISNPINVVVCDLLDISFLEYSTWMAVPAVVSIVVSYLGIRFAFRNLLPHRFVALPPENVSPRQARAMMICAAVLSLTLLALFIGERAGIPVWAVAASSAALLLLLHPYLVQKNTYGDVVRGISWDVIVFLMGIFLVTRGVVGACVSEGVKESFVAAAEGHPMATLFSTSLGSGVLSAFLNNHPTADLAAQLLVEMPLDTATRQFLAFGALIGGDLGPKMLPIGSLAALIWFGLLRQRGVEVRYGLYVAIGVPVTLAAIVISTLVLQAEIAFFAG
ncbi:MAG: ArsB/NhaD family transporter [Planctomycetota bacterium]|jgi:arsenical pump membrane protein